MPHRFLRCVVLVVAAGIAASTRTAARDPAPASALNWVFDGAVQTTARLADTLYVGGTFTAVAPSANVLPPIYALSETTGSVVEPALPAIAGEVLVVEPDGATLSVGLAPRLVVAGVPPGVYVARVRALSTAGTGPPSDDVVVRVP